MRKIGDHAVVLGASMGGLLAARVLADAYQRVTIVDRDLLPERVADRQGVPQGLHAHALLARGAQTLDALFRDCWPTWRRLGCRCWPVPGSCGSRSGVICCAWTVTVTARTRATWPAGRIWKARSAARVRALDNVSVRDRCAAAGLVTTPARDRVTGVRVRPAGSGDEEIRR